MNLKDIHHIHAVGIGGIGLSALCKLLAVQGKVISGSDLASTVVTEWFERRGFSIHFFHDAANIPAETQLVLRSVSVPNTNPEIVAAKKHGLPVASYPEALAVLFNPKFGIGISGTNGKTTTTSLTGLLLEAAGLDPTVIVGGRVKEFDGNMRAGESEYVVAEADEFARAFHHYTPNIAVITNIEEDHLDVYKNLEEIKASFVTFIHNVKKDGIVIANSDDANVRDTLHRSSKKRLTFGFGEEADVRAVAIHADEGHMRFHLVFRGNDLGECMLRVPGEFNVMNAIAAAAVALQLNVNIGTIKKTFENFRGTWRRFEILGEWRGATVVSDYAHHPTAVAKTVKAAREFYPKRRIVAVFQPHHHHRTKALFREFVQALATADRVVVPEIYKVEGRTESMNISSSDLVKEVRRLNGEGKYVASLDELKPVLESFVQRGDVLLLMGAGDIYKTAEKLIG